MAGSKALRSPVVDSITISNITESESVTGSQCAVITADGLPVVRGDRHDVHALNVAHPEVPVTIPLEHLQTLTWAGAQHISSLVSSDRLRPDNQHWYRGPLDHLLRHATEDRVLQAGHAARPDCDDVHLKLLPQSHN